MFNQRYLKKKYICPILIFSMQIDIQIIKKQTKNLFMLDAIIPKAREKPNFSNALSMAFDKFWFLNFVHISTEKLVGINFAITATQTLYF